MNTSYRKHAEIAGAGFAGLTAAISLKQRGWSVTVHESNKQLREIGAGLFMWENGLKALAQIGLAQSVLQKSFKAISSDVSVDGVLQSSHATNTPDTHPMLTLTRGSLYEAILKGAMDAGVEIRTDSKVAGADQEGIWLADGSLRPADLIVAADGVASAVRDSLPVTKTRKKFNYGITRLLTSRRGLEGRQGDRVVDHWRLGTFARRILYAPCSASIAYLAMMSVLDDGKGIAIPVNHDVWAKDFPALRYLIEDRQTDGRFNTYESTHVEQWAHGRIVLVGDAAHGMPPTLAQGAGCAIMNAVAIADCLEDFDDVADGLAQWEARQRPFTESIQSKAEALAGMGVQRSKLTKAELTEAARQPAAAS